MQENKSANHMTEEFENDMDDYFCSEEYNNEQDHVNAMIFTFAHKLTSWEMEEFYAVLAASDALSEKTALHAYAIGLQNYEK